MRAVSTPTAPQRYRATRATVMTMSVAAATRSRRQRRLIGLLLACLCPAPTAHYGLSRKYA